MEMKLVGHLHVTDKGTTHVREVWQGDSLQEIRARTGFDNCGTKAASTWSVGCVAWPLRVSEAVLAHWKKEGNSYAYKGGKTILYVPLGEARPAESTEGYVGLGFHGQAKPDVPKELVKPILSIGKDKPRLVLDPSLIDPAQRKCLKQLEAATYLVSSRFLSSGKDLAVVLSTTKEAVERGWPIKEYVGGIEDAVRVVNLRKDWKDLGVRSAEKGEREND